MRRRRNGRGRWGLVLASLAWLSGCDRMPDAVADFRGLLANSPVGEPFGPLRAVRDGMTRDEARAAVDQALRAEATWVRKWLEFDFDLWPGDLTVRSTSAHFYNVNPEAALVAAWGEPSRGTFRGQRTLFWFSRTGESRATLDQAGKSADGRLHWVLAIQPCLPLARLLAPGPETLGFETTPLLGATEAQLAADYGRFLRPPDPAVPGTVLEILPTEYENSPYTAVHVALSSGRVTELRLEFRYTRYPGAKDLLLNALRARYGEPVRGTYGAGGTLILREEPRISARAGDREGRLTLRAAEFEEDEEAP